MRTASHLDLRTRYRDYGAARPCQVSVSWRAESFRATEGRPMTIRRALALNAVLDKVDLPVFPGEWIVGAGLPLRMAPAGAVEDDAWKRDAEYLGTIGGRDFGSHSDHHAPDYPTLLAEGLGGVRRRAAARRETERDGGKRDFLESVVIGLDGASHHVRRWADALAAEAAKPSPYQELLRLQADSFRHLAGNPPRTFHEALQLVNIFHFIMQLDDRAAMAFGRLDQDLYPFYATDKKAGRLDDETALAILVHFFEKTTITEDVQNIAIGGVKPADGSDATNELSFHILEACKRVGRPGGNITARIHKATPHAFLKKCADVIRTGIGYPAVFNDEVQIPALVDQGFPLQASRDYCFVGCIEVFIPGRMAPWSDSRFNLLYCVNLALNDGVDSLTGTRVGVATGDRDSFGSFYEAFLVQMRARMKAHVETLNAYKQKFQNRPMDFTSPLMSALTADCIERGRDMNDGGARWPGHHGVAGMGIGVTADSLAAIRQFVYTERRFALAELRKMLDANFEGFQRERQLLLREAPKYGNDDAAVDELAVRVTADFGTECMTYRTPCGGRYWGLMAANVQNIWAGTEVGASADGRLSREPLSDAASPTFGRDKRGPTAVIRSVAKLPYQLCPGGNVINMKLSPETLKGDEGLDSLAYLIRTCFDLGGIQLQFNTIDRAMLQEAMEKPREHENLVTRVSGFSAHFVYLDRRVQEDILARTEYAKLL